MTTVIVHLSHECSGMRVWGMHPVLYREQGEGVAFPGACLHESLPRRQGEPAGGEVWKLAMFWA